ncbi:MAG: hypothetical protein QOF78_3131 [Phycisphaerales bacterium]|nr:hypothetical protein [Phycisphaerales bacterium]
MAVVTCECGARVRVPDDASGAFRCPRCRVMIAAPAPVGAGEGAAGQFTTTDVSRARGEATTCPTCQTVIAGDAPRLFCPSCGQPHHQECWDEIGGCAVYGCKSAPETIKQPDTEPARFAWGDVKSCPMCGEQIKSIALKCRFCGANFDTVDPLDAWDLRKRVTRQQGAQSLRTGVIALFVLSLIGVIAPLMLIINLIFVLANRARLKEAGPVMLVLAYASIALSVVYCVLMLVLIVSGA